MWFASGGRTIRAGSTYFERANFTTSTGWRVTGCLSAPIALLFFASVATTIYFCQSMSGGMAMLGGWTMSVARTKVQGQRWLAATASFMGMWVVMMAAMSCPRSTVRIACKFFDFLKRTDGVPDLEDADYMASTIRSGIDDFYTMEQWGRILTGLKLRSGFSHQFLPSNLAREHLLVSAIVPEVPTRGSHANILLSTHPTYLQ
jgi:hypothetical protein